MLVRERGHARPVAGTDAVEYLQGQLTNDIEALEPGEGCYAALLDRKGHMQADMRVLRLDADEIWLDPEPEALGARRRHLTMYRVGRDVEIEDPTDAMRVAVADRARRGDESPALPPLAGENAHRDGRASTGVEVPRHRDRPRRRPDRRRARRRAL